MAEVSAGTTCLQCGESHGAVRAERLFCATVSAWETVETEDEWERHRWADWSDRELDLFGIVPDAYDRHRRTPLLHMQWVACEDHKRGHVYAGPPADQFDLPQGQCWGCGKYAPDSSDTTTGAAS